MIEIKNNNSIIELQTSDKKNIYFNTSDFIVKIEDLDVNHPGEYEKSGILLEVKEYNDILFYSFSVDGKHIIIITNDNFELKEEILSFFGDVDLLIIVGSQKSAKIFENIEARVVVPFGEGKHSFFTSLGQHLETLSSYKMKGELSSDETEFVNLEG